MRILLDARLLSQTTLWIAHELTHLVATLARREWGDEYFVLVADHGLDLPGGEHIHYLRTDILAPGLSEERMWRAIIRQCHIDELWCVDRSPYFCALPVRLILTDIGEYFYPRSGSLTSGLQQRRLRSMIARAQSILVPTLPFSRELQDSFVTKGSVRVFCPDREYTVTKNETEKSPYILTSSQGVAANIERTIEAYLELECPPRLLVIGPETRETLRARERLIALKRTSDIVFLGAIPFDRYGALVAMSQGVVITALYAWYCPLAEMAYDYKKPLLISNRPWGAELDANRCDPLSHQSIRQGIQQLLSTAYPCRESHHRAGQSLFEALQSARG